MKCPYRSVVSYTRINERGEIVSCTEGGAYTCAEYFPDCYGEECPLYRKEYGCEACIRCMEEG